MGINDEKTVYPVLSFAVCLLSGDVSTGWLVYKFTAERAGKQSLDDLMNSSLYLMRSELREILRTTGEKR